MIRLHDYCQLILFYASGGCKAPADISSVYVLDPCNCTSFYELIQHPVPSKERKVCRTDELWNYKINQCRSNTSVLESRLCDRGSPWDRCIDLTGKYFCL